MLKALELYGFKSFAERTRFEFPPGITVVVGPNGSGKSNVVDAMKWVLGEQSVKSLRGKEMSDVIFKGSGDGRKAMNSAEATIVFDNSTGHLPYDAPEVHVTRRVYRSGEGEYLINNQACRLRDIKDMFRGSGVGTDAYSIIEQGKLDVLVSASPKERRTVFEEAAGISRFKAKKVEAQRRLERVEQNMLRLSDIVEEVDSRLRTVRAQAGKAQRYKEYSDRLQQLRTQVGLTDWRKLTESLESLDAESAVLREEIAAANARSQQLETSAQEVEAKFLEADDAIRSLQSQLARNRESIAAGESSCEHHAARVRDLDEEADHCRGRVAAAGAKAGDLHARVSDAVRELELAEQEHGQVAGVLAELEREISELDQRGESLRNASEARRIEFMKAMRDSATLGNRLSAGESQLESAAATAARRQATLAELTSAAEEALQQIEQLGLDTTRLKAESDWAAAELAEAVSGLSELRRLRSESAAGLSKLENKQAGLTERIALLSELEARREGVDAGAMQLLGGSHAGVHGLVADLLQVNVEIAPLIDAVLGDAAQYVVIEGESRFQELLQRQQSGRVGLVRLEDAAVRRAPGDISQEPGVIGRADQLIETSRRYRPLFERLLGDAWVVESLDAANRLWHDNAGQLRLITAGGTIVTRAGAAVLGSAGGASGIISRRSELRFLEADLEALDERVTEQQAQVADFARRITDQQAAHTRLDELQRERMATLTQQRAQLATAEHRREQLLVGRDAAQQELNQALQQQQTLTAEMVTLRDQIEQAEGRLSDMEQAIHADRRELSEIESQRTAQQAEATATKVLLAKCEQRLENLRTRLEQFEEDRRERTRAIVDARRQLALCFERRDQAELEILRTTSQIALLYLEKERIAAQASELQQSRKEYSSQRTTLLEAAAELRNSLRKREDKLHKKDMAAGEIRLQRTSLEDRLREDYGLEISQLVEQAQAENEEQRLALEEEIADLRRKISNIGAVNLDALQELDELDQRYSTLAAQHEDLVKAKDALVRIITKINTDSRRLFTETLEIIRQNFQRIFRKLFGGGKADILLEPGVDELEAGVEIVANPPGKQALNMSLLSGGERALCAVSLLMAIFEFRPSPFCVLDEVDGPLDEANIGRFVDQLRDFLGWTKFVIVTHSKKTMTAATTLYGVTMQESGISKRVSVKFEDVSDTGHISQEAVEREAQAVDDGQAA